MEQKLIKCSKCLWVHFEVSRQYAMEQVDKFNEYFNTLSRDEQIKFYGGKECSIEQYEHCMRCNASHELAIDAQEEDSPLGSTINPLINPKEKR